MKTPCKLIKYGSNYIVISDGLFGKADFVFTNEKGRPMVGIVQKVLINKFAVVDVAGVVHRFFNCKKIVAHESAIHSVDIEIVNSTFAGMSKIVSFNNEIAELIIKEKLDCWVDFEEGTVFNKIKIVLFVTQKKVCKLAKGKV